MQALFAYFFEKRGAFFPPSRFPYCHDFNASRPLFRNTHARVSFLSVYGSFRGRWGAGSAFPGCSSTFFAILKTAVFQRFRILCSQPPPSAATCQAPSPNCRLSCFRVSFRSRLTSSQPDYLPLIYRSSTAHLGKSAPLTEPQPLYLGPGLSLLPTQTVICRDKRPARNHPFQVRHRFWLAD